ncbi:AmmeMemoRadiSam system protein A [Candidatus Falkowbacteria bacterium]|nr:AmmeMemoRadiSam system protein A [Candidatus Falkowbacteria bacterium]
MNQYIKLAQDAVEAYIKGRKIIKAPDDLPQEFYNQRAGVFVTIFNNKKLRSCIGTFIATEDNIAAELISNAIAACSRDTRFSKITADELPNLNYEVSILSEPKFVDDIKKLDAKKYGVIVATADGRRGLLLPNLEGVDSVAEQISIASKKGGINIEKDDFELYSFTVEKYK